MKEIIIGKEGNQPFPIKSENDGVSRKHAKITITDNGDWYLEDLNSTNGTAIRNEETGELIPVNDRIRISSMSFIMLGPDSARGCGFYAKQVTGNSGFTEEHEYLVQKEDYFDELLEQVDRNTKKLNVLKIVLLVIFLSFAYLYDTKSSPILILGRMSVATLPSAIIQVLYNPTERKKEIKKIRDKFSHCPNPTCSNRLTSKEVRDMRCSRCKK